MKKIFTANEMQNIENNTINIMGMPSLVLMERAAMSVLDELKENFYLHHVLVICSNGNNGADGMAVARLLKNSGVKVDIWFLGNENALTHEAKVQFNCAKKYNIDFIDEPDVKQYSTIVDAIFGIGLNRNVEGRFKTVINRINEAKIPVIAIDIPSGINASNGKEMGIAIYAKETVSFAYGKIGLYINDGYTHCGQVKIKDIGIYADEDIGINALEDNDIPLLLPHRAPNGNKGTFGKALIIAGSKNMAGAAFLSAKAAFMCGVGMVKIFTDESNRIILQQLLPEAMLCTYSEDDTDETLMEKLQSCENWANCVLCGPGLDTNKQANLITKFLLKENTTKQLILDADSLNIISETNKKFDDTNRPIVITPHMGEMSRLSGYTISELKDAPFEKINEFHKSDNLNIIMKDYRTIMLTQDGKTYINLNGNDGMATAGSGDTLSGILAGLISQGISPSIAVPLGVYIHGKAGDKAAELKGKYAMTSTDIVNAVGTVLKEATE